ncbi:MAG: hypothetical protein BAA04_02735 [Firmicutes bacterium ZCTH02-B6]|nr:MAG: hypothetical protein BAA04_02735 [Firmicutes bacterium ZCTH02-B6]
MSRALGAALVFGAAAMIGAVVARAHQDRPRVLRSLQAALTMLQTEIVYAGTPLPEALGQVARRTPPPTGAFFAAAADILRSRPGITAGEAWQEALRAGPGWPLTVDDELVLQDLGACLGRSDAADQQKHLQLALTQLARLQAEAEAQREAQVRLWRWLGVCAGGCLVLLLY